MTAVGSRRGAFLIGMALLAAACARYPRERTFDDLYVLLPDRAGSGTGALSVTHGGVERTLATPYAAARVTRPGHVDVGVSSPEEVRTTFGAALAALPPRPVTFILHFGEGREDLSPDARALVTSAILPEVARRDAAEVVVVGHTDRMGSVAANDVLALRRAERVRDELVGLGIPRDRIEVAGRGEREPLVPTPDEVPEPRNRRVEIVVR